MEPGAVPSSAPGPENLGRVGFGSGTMIAAGFGAVAEDDARAAVAQAFELGVRFFDTAQFYGSGRSEAILGEVIGGCRDQITLCTKGGVRYTDPSDLRSLRCDASYDGLAAAIAESLGRLRADYADIYLLHQFDPALTPEQQMESLQRLKDQGLARAVGFCNFGTEASRRAIATGIPTVVEYSFSLLDHRYLTELADMKRRGGRRITFGSYVHGLLSEALAEDHDFGPDDWRGRSRRTGQSGTSGNVFFAGEAFARNVAVARGLRAIAGRLGLSLAAFVLALTLREEASDVVLMGCRTAREVADGLSGLDCPLTQEVLGEVEQILAGADRPAQNMLGLQT
jgi:aryl-alcohol dehydrogenase-like predicted oxidoreductase